MALTKIKADGLTADLIDETKLADNSIDSEHYNDGSIDNAHLADDAVGVAELSATGTASSSTFLRGDNSWTAVNTDLVSDTSPQLGGTLDSNGHVISVDDSSSVGTNLNRIKVGTGDDLHIWHNSGTNNTNISAYSGDLYLQGNNGSGTAQNQIAIKSNAAVELNYQGTKKFETTSTGVKVDGGLIEIAHTSCHLDFMESSTTNHRLRNGSGNFLIQRISDDKNTTTTQFDIDGGTGAVSLYHEGTKKLSTTANGICFNSDTAAANALDDYEEGSWTPVVLDQNGSNYSISATTAETYYTKIGRLVTLMFNITNNESGSKTGYLYMPTSCFPFTPAQGTQNGTFWVDHGGPTTGMGDIIGGIMNVGSSGAWFTKPSDESGMGYSSSRYLEHGQWAQNRPIYGSFQFITS